MIAIREIKKPVNRRIVIDLPADFAAHEVEVIIIPLEGENKSGRKRTPGLLKGKMRMMPDFNEPLEDFREYME